MSAGSIDDMIVYMKFDNKQFEAGIQHTLTSLENLKKNLNFDGAIRNFADLDAAGRNTKVTIDTKGVSDSVKEVTKATDNLESVKAKIIDLKKVGENIRMRFDGTAFGRGIDTAVGQIDRFKQSAQFQGVLKGLETVSAYASRFNLSGMGVSIDQVKAKFENLQVVGVAALATLTAKAVDAGVQMANKLFIENPKAGLQEYETNLNSIQTILANTASKGTTLDNVNAALSELNAYSDQTIYNFAQMANSIGKFTSAGVGLDTSVASIKGFSNVAALSGASAEEASGAMQELSKAMSSGVIRLEDWMSFETRGMSSEAFRNSLMETARVHGVGVDDMIKKEGSFRNSLKHNWITTDIMSETLRKFTGDMTDAQLASIGYTDEQIKGIQLTAKMAKESATVVKTGTALIGTLAETTQSGWAATWQIVIGDFEEAKALWTNVNNVLGGMIGSSADRRNKLLQGWKDLGGRDVAIEALSNAFKILMGILTPIGKAFREVFPPMTAQRLYDITVKIRDFTKALLPTEKSTSVLYNVFKFLFSIMKIGIGIVTGIFKVLFATVGALFKIGTGAANAGAGFGEFFAKVVNWLSKVDVSKYFQTIADAITKLGPILGIAAGFIGAIFSAIIAGIAGFVNGGFDVAMTRVRERLESFGMLGQILIGLWDRVKNAAKQVWAVLEPLRNAIAKMFQDIGQNLKDVFTDVNFDQVLDLVNVGLLGGLVLLFRNFFKRILGMGDGLKENLLEKMGDSFEGIVNALDGVTGVLKAMQTNLQADTLVKIAIAIGVLTASVVILSLIDSGKLTQALLAMTVMFTQLGIAMKIFEATASGPGIVKLPIMAAGLILLAIAIGVLAGAVKKLSGMDWGELIKGLVGVTALLLGLSVAARIMSANAKSLFGVGAGMILIAIAIRILAGAIKEFGGMDFGAMVQGLIGVAAVLVGLSIFNNMTKVNKGSFASMVGLVLLATAIKLLASAVADFATLSLGNLLQGMGALYFVLGTLSSFIGSTQNTTGVFKTAVAMVVLGAAMKIFVSAVSDMANLAWEGLIKGLAGFAIILKTVSVAMQAMPKGMPAIAVGLILVGVAMKIMASALGDLGGLSWEEIGKSLVVLAGALLIMAVAVNAMTGALTGAAAIFVVAAALAILAPVIQTLGAMPLDQLGIAMAALAAVFIIFGLAGLVLAPLTPVLMALGVAIGIIGLGMMAAGIGVLAFATGLILLATIGAATVPVIVGLVTQILGLIPTALRMLGEGIVQFAAVLGENIPVFVDAMVKLLLGLLQAINTVAGPIIDTLMNLIGLLLKALLDNVPNFLVMGLKLIVALLQGIADNIDDVVIAAVNIVIALLNGIANRLPDLITAGVNVVVAFLKGVGENTKKLSDAAFKLVIDFLNGIADSIRDNSQKMREAGANIGSAIIEGVTGGIKDGVNTVINAAKGLADSAINAAKNLLNINSPSRVFRDEVGAQISAGMAVGITAKGYMVDRAVEGVGDNALDTMKRAMANVTKVASTLDPNLSPTIRPVLDLSSVRKDAGVLNGMFKSPTLTVAGNFAKAQSLLDREASNRAAAERNSYEEPPTTGGGDTYNQFTQINNSPKSLSTAEVYRQTNNLISAAKKEL